MIRYIIVSVISGILFGILDGVIHANPLAQRLYEVYKPIARTSLNPLAGIVIDLIYGFVMAGVFLLLYKSLPGETGLIKGVSQAVLPPGRLTPLEGRLMGAVAPRAGAGPA